MKNPSIRDAKKYLTQHKDFEKFSPYSMAWIITNEQLRPTMKYSDGATNALTVAASGDHPMFTKIHGATHVDTFDISYNAKLIMDIKTTALSLLNHDDYCKLLKAIYIAWSHVSDIPNMPEIIERLSKAEQRYFSKMDKYKLFGRDYYFESKALPTKSEYEKMRTNIDKSFNFIWSDITNLHTKLKKKYDFMHISNIFDYLETYSACTEVLESLIPYTARGCKICMMGYHKNMEAICEGFIWKQQLQNFNELSWRSHQVKNIANTYVLQRKR